MDDSGTRKDSKRKSNYDIQVERVQPEFVKWDHALIARSFNLPLDDAFLYITFIDQQYRISRNTGAVEKFCDDGTCSPAGFNAVMSIFDLLSRFDKALMLSGEWTPIQNLSGLMHAGRAIGSDLFTPYAECIDRSQTAFIQACERTGGKAAPYADASYIFRVFDCLPVMLQFWESDDEFPAQLKIFMDTNTLDFVLFETTFYIASALLDRIKEVMDILSNQNP